MIWHWIAYNPLWWPMTGLGYAMGSSWFQVSMLGVFYVTWKRHNCHESRCLRVARNVLEKDGHHQLYCHKHLKGHKDAER